MDRLAQDLSPTEPILDAGRPHRPRDLALLLLALGTDPPRDRARDQQADRAGGEILRRILDAVSALDPEADAIESTLASIVAEMDRPSGPARAVASRFHQEWQDAQSVPGLWSWLLSEALERSERPRSRGGLSRGTS